MRLLYSEPETEKKHSFGFRAKHMPLPSSVDPGVLFQVSHEAGLKKHGFGFGIKHKPPPLSADLGVVSQLSPKPEPGKRHGFGFGAKYTQLPLSADPGVSSQFSRAAEPKKLHGFGFGTKNPPLPSSADLKVTPRLSHEASQLSPHESPKKDTTLGWLRSTPHCRKRRPLKLAQVSQQCPSAARQEGAVSSITLLTPL